MASSSLALGSQWLWCRLKSPHMTPLPRPWYSISLSTASFVLSEPGPALYMLTTSSGPWLGCSTTEHTSGCSLSSSAFWLAFTPFLTYVIARGRVSHVLIGVNTLYPGCTYVLWSSRSLLTQGSCTHIASMLSSYASCRAVACTRGDLCVFICSIRMPAVCLCDVSCCPGFWCLNIYWRDGVSWEPSEGPVLPSGKASCPPRVGHHS